MDLGVGALLNVGEVHKHHADFASILIQLMVANRALELRSDPRYVTLSSAQVTRNSAAFLLWMAA